MRRAGLCAMLTVTCAALLGACAGSPAPSPTPTAAPATPAAAVAPAGPVTLTIGTGGTGGVFAPFGGGLARVLTAKMPNTKATPQETGGSLDNVELIKSGGAQLGLVQVDAAYDAVSGTGPFARTGKVPLQALAVLYQGYIHVVVRADGPIQQVADLRGRSVSVGAAGSNTETAANRVLEAAGLNPASDITRANLGLTESIGLLAASQLDALVWVGGLPAPAIAELAQGTGVRILPLGALAGPLSQKYGPIYSPATLKAGVYQGVDADVAGVGIATLLVAPADLPAEQVTAILTTIFANLPDLQTAHPAAQGLTLEGAAAKTAIPFHPAAVAFYQAKGVWKG